ncbi:MAG TPA: FG-GAP-like repeat-containing protein [Pirellulales bacterium]|nr:FG-GAP-like repeat-containing protein [Pirellulales bacterium]
MSFSKRSTFGVLLTVVLLVAGAIGYVLWSQSRLPAPGSPEYEQYVDAFQVGVAALDADVPQMAEESLTQAVKIIPEEPAAWADRGIVYLRSSRLKEAAHDLNEATRLAPDDPQIQKLVGLLEQLRGRYGEAVTWLERAVEHDPQDIRALYLLTQVVEQEHKEGSEARHQQLLERVLELRPNNLRVLTDYLRLAVRRSDEKAVQDGLARLKRLSPGWSKAAQEELLKVEERLGEKLGPSGVSRVLGLANLLKAEPGFLRDAIEVSPPNELVGDSLQTFLRLAPVRPAPAAPDADLRFAAEPMPDAPDGAWRHMLAIWLNGKGEPETFLVNDAEIRRIGSDVVLPAQLKPTSLTPIDWNNDLRTDLVVSGEGGLRFYQQQEDGGFQDVTAQIALGDDVLHANFDGALAADVDLDGDLDLLLARGDDSPLFLRNNFDGTFTPSPIFESVKGAQRFVWADFDHDGAPDAALLDRSGQLSVFANEHSASFRPWPVEPPQTKFSAFTAADANDDGVFDIVAIDQEGRLSCISDKDKRAAWDVKELAVWEGMDGDQPAIVDRLLAGDFDNNGAVDLLVSTNDGSRIWLKEAGGKFRQLGSELPPRIQAAADLRGQGRLDLLALDDAGKPFRLVNSGKKNYHWQNVRPQATQDKAEGDNRINSFGIGGTIELRTGTHVVKQPIDAPVVHFGLGERKQADVTRIVWPNGAFQAEFKTPIDEVVLAVQRLKGSCPFLFAFDGQRMAFVSDFMWSTPLGMYINAADKGGFLQTTDWVKVPGQSVARRDGKYELRVNANLWETHFFDHLALIAVDHPAETEMFVDERFFMEPSEPAFYLTEPPQTVAAARDHLGRDASQEISAVDDVYLDRCGRGAYQGLTRDHWVEVDLGPDAPETGPLWLVARGWIHPTDSSINYALGQGRHDAPRGLSLEVPDSQGGWTVAHDRLGFPAGKNKTMLVRLDGLGGNAQVPRRFRLRTNMEIYWDWIAYARPRDDAPREPRRLSPEKADLRFRGILAMTQANRSSPELPDYDRLVATGQYWRDLIGYHTRHGDIRELIESVDDRYAIVTAGDEIVLEFAAPPDPRPGWKRDFIWVADGWVKDGDFNTRFGKTVLPLPAHDMNDYVTPPGELEDDPVYRRQRADWQTYHTRYVTPYAFERGLRGFHADDGE